MDSQSKTTKGYMHYVGALCLECGRKYIKRSFDKIVVTVETCAYCDEPIEYYSVNWYHYVNWMEDGAILVSQI